MKRRESGRWLVKRLLGPAGSKLASNGDTHAGGFLMLDDRDAYADVDPLRIMYEIVISAL